MTKSEKMSVEKRVTYGEIPYENVLCEVFNAVKDILGTLRENEDDPDSPPLFKIIALNTGQLSPVRKNEQNEGPALLFPAVFLRFINVRYSTQQSRIGEGRAIFRIQYVINHPNLNDGEVELEGYRFFQRINVALLDAKSKYPALKEEFNLAFFDHPEAFCDGFQTYWVDYEVSFTDYAAHKYRNYVDRYLVCPPFTNHSDQLSDNNNENHENHNGPQPDQVSGFV